MPMSDNTVIVSVFATIFLSGAACIITCIVYDKPDTCAEWSEGPNHNGVRYEGAEFDRRFEQCLHERKLVGPSETQVEVDKEGER